MSRFENHLPPRRHAFASIILYVACCLISLTGSAQNQSTEAAGTTSTMSVRQARSELQRLLQSMWRAPQGTGNNVSMRNFCGLEGDVYSQDPMSDIKIEGDGFEFTDRGHMWDRWAGCLLCSPKQGKEYEQVRTFKFSALAHISAMPCGKKSGAFGVSDGRRWLGNGLTFWYSAQEAQEFADVLNRLASAANGNDSASQAEQFQQFKQQADQWRALAVKPAMPEDARVHKVLAENAVEEKNFDKATNEYEAALKIFPTWPEGQFNAALLSGQAQDYSEAILHMQCYLELVPDAPNAQDAKDKLIIWRDKLEHPSK